jgi:hypothetical protein
VVHTPVLTMDKRTGRQGRRRKQLLYDFKVRGYWKEKEKTLDRTMWRTGFGRGYGLIVRLRKHVTISKIFLEPVPKDDICRFRAVFCRVVICSLK